MTINEGDRWLVDVGFGASGFVYPLRFIEMETQEQKNGAYRIRSIPESEGEYLLEKIPKTVIKGRVSSSKTFFYLQLVMQNIKSTWWSIRKTTTSCRSILQNINYRTILLCSEFANNNSSRSKLPIK